jgi:hypothetical protein
MSDLGSDWRVLDGVTTAWFDAPSLTAAAAFAGRALDIDPDALVDVRATGARVRVGAAHTADASAAALDLGLVTNPAVLPSVSVVIESADTAAVGEYWQRVLGYTPVADGLVDPLQRDPAVHLRSSAETRPLRHRVHLDVSRPAAVVERAGLGEAFGPYGVCHADTDGNEVDVVPGDPLGEAAETADWQIVFRAVACYRTSSVAQQRDLVTAAAALADEVGFPLLIDVRPGLVIVDSGKDQWEANAHGLDVDFPALAAAIQSAARSLGATADTESPRFVQLFLDAADVEAVRNFWLAALGYVRDRRDEPTDIIDPRRLNPVLLFQELDATDTARREQRNRIHFELAVPADMVEARVATAVQAGGRVVHTEPGRTTIADPEGNELVITSRG